MFGDQQNRKNNKVVKVKIGWHWLVEEEKMPFIECLLWAAKGLAYIILLNPHNNLSRWVLLTYFIDEETELMTG